MASLQPINTVWAENNEGNKSSFNARQYGLGITYNARVLSNQLNGLFSDISEAVQWLQKSGGYYINSKRYNYGDVITILRATTTYTYRIENYLCIASETIVGTPPIKDAVEVQDSSYRVIIYSGGIEDTSNWKRVYPEQIQKFENTAPDASYVYRLAKFSPPSLTTETPDETILQLSQNEITLIIGKSATINAYTNANSITATIDDERLAKVSVTESSDNTQSVDTPNITNASNNISNVSSQDYEEYGFEFILTLINSYGQTTCKVSALNSIVLNAENELTCLPNGLGWANFDVLVSDIKTNCSASAYTNYTSDLMPYGARLELGYTIIDNVKEYGLFLKTNSSLQMFRVEAFRVKGVDISVNESYSDTQDTTSIGTTYFTDLVIPLVEGASTQPHSRIGKLVDFAKPLTNEYAYKNGLLKSQGVTLIGVNARIFSLLLNNTNQLNFVDTRFTTTTSLPEGVSVNDRILENGAVSVNNRYDSVVGQVIKFLGESWSYDIYSVYAKCYGKYDRAWTLVWMRITQSEWGVANGKAGKNGLNSNMYLYFTREGNIEYLLNYIKNNDRGEYLEFRALNSYIKTDGVDVVAQSGSIKIYYLEDAVWDSDVGTSENLYFRFYINNISRVVQNVENTTTFYMWSRMVRTGLIYHTYYFYTSLYSYTNCLISSGRSVKNTYTQPRNVVDRYIYIC